MNKSCKNVIFCIIVLYRDSTENLKQIFPERNCAAQVQSRIDQPILLQENMWTDPGNM
jgi:hypothetical protein